jgi:NTE family protein
MRFGDIARWTICKMGFMRTERMNNFLARLLKKFRFEEMQIPLGIVATDLQSGAAIGFHESGDVVVPIRASCSYPGIFQPVLHDGRLLVDGGISCEVPAQIARAMGATHVIAVSIPMQAESMVPGNMFEVVNRCFQIIQHHRQETWRKFSDVVIEPAVSANGWNAFDNGLRMIEAGEAATRAALPLILKMLQPDEGVTTTGHLSPRLGALNGALAPNTVRP